MTLLDTIWNTRSYFFWLMIVSLFCLTLERLVPWRKGQRLMRRELLQDVFFLVFNGHYFSILLAYVSAWVILHLHNTLSLVDLPFPDQMSLLSSSPLIVQFLVFLLFKDFLEWCVHNLLHRLPWLWQIHKLHHSIEIMDWIGNFRFHWMEIIIYRTLTWLPLVLLGIDGNVMLWVAIVVTLIGHLNHSNVRIDWGPFRYILNSSRLHVWHHDYVLHKKYGQNFAIVFSLWDWLFGTAFLPADTEQPERLGFHGIERFPRNLPMRLVYPLFSSKRNMS